MRNFIIAGVLVAVIALTAWRVMAGKIDRADPNAVAGAFLTALKAERIDKAADYYVPEGAEAWKTQTVDKLDRMGSQTRAQFLEDMVATPPFTSSRGPKAPANEQKLTTGGTSVEVRQTDGKWYVSKAPI